MRLRPKIIDAILLLAAITLWVALVVIFIYQYAVLKVYDPVAPIQIGPEFRFIFAGFFLVLLIYFARIFGRIEQLNVITLLWRLFFMGMIGVGVMLIAIISHLFTKSMTLAAYLSPILFFLSIFALLIFFLSATFIFRRFILYQRTQRKLRAWYFFLGLLVLSALASILEITLGRQEQIALVIFYILFIIVSIYLATNVRWIAYLNFNQKLRSLGLFALILVVCITCVAVLNRFPTELNIPFSSVVRTDFIYFIMIFTFTYSGFSVLVLFFNLPTSSIFEINSLEIASVSKINQAIQSNLDFTDITNSLLDASIMASNAKGGWLEMLNSETGEPEIKICKRIPLKEVQDLKQGYDLTNKVLKDRKHFLIKNTRKHKAFRYSNSRMRSLLSVPIMSNNHQYGAVYVVSDLVNSFEDVTVRSVHTFAEQAGMALENAQLVQESIEMERYQEQLKIAKQVQEELLPKSLPGSSEVTFVAVSENAQEVGGDYFDVVQSEDHIFKVAIGDVSGKGTTAAFYMAEIKGIFHALSLMDLDPEGFICSANIALSRCMQKGFFMTLTYLEIDTQKQEVSLVRAGHCPSFFINKKEKEVSMLKEGTLGLGIVRDKSYRKFLGKPEHIKYEKGDTLVLYTDGIVEARNGKGEEFGYKRLGDMIRKCSAKSPKELAANIVDAAKNFTIADLQDDYTVMVIRFDK